MGYTQEATFLLKYELKLLVRIFRAVIFSLLSGYIADKIKVTLKKLKAWYRRIGSNEYDSFPNLNDRSWVDAVALGLQRRVLFNKFLDVSWAYHLQLYLLNFN